MSPFHTTEPQTWINKNYPSQACEKLMRVRRRKKEWGPRRDGPVHKSLPNFRMANMLTPAPRALAGEGEGRQWWYFPSAGVYSPSGGGDSSTPPLRSRPRTLDFQYSVIPTTVAGPGLLYLTICNSWLTCFQKDLMLLTAVGRIGKELAAVDPAKPRETG